MDALGLDFMLPEYQEKRKDAEDAIRSPRRNRSPSPAPSSEDSYEAEVGSSETVPATDEPDFSQLEVDPTTAAVFKKKVSSSSSSSIQENRSGSQSSSFYTPATMSPIISYDRDHPAQKLVAVFGRQFDRPYEIASHFQKQVQNTLSPDAPEVKFLPFTMERSSLMKGHYSSEELCRHNLVCMCYNASEARILLTGTDGFYTSLLKRTEANLGPNKVAFLITNFNRYKQAVDNELVSAELKSRLYQQESLCPYLDGDQVLSWVGQPSNVHLTRLIELAGAENNPKSIVNQACAIL